MSPFQKANSAPCTPSREDEQWLRDTIPLSNHSTPLGRSASTKENVQRQTCSSPKCSDIDTTERGECDWEHANLVKIKYKHPLCTFPVRESKSTSSSPTQGGRRCFIQSFQDSECLVHNMFDTFPLL
ncbi:hypothetical protein LENED_003544 [Lentinula edodes]|uniref:Uncharacterized protein n=1 Tax=Lentinula edodes TaxID=5353 RepID=A0A1Q3E426_LENED|nr:hypothetical protein LENED_003544 [Lentinula edodes]